jgi:glucose-6-phosphate isomerase
VITLNDKYLDRYIDGKELAEMLATEAEVAYRKVIDGTAAGADVGLGWVKLPAEFDADELARIKQTAQQIRDKFDALVVIGIGGSYLGTRAIVESLRPDRDKMVLYFAGKDLNALEIDRLYDKLEGKSWAINVVSKSGTTTEPAVALRILRAKLHADFPDDADQRIFATTDAEKGTLHDLAVKRGWQRFVVPDDIVGRYSVLSAVGLLPIAAAGIDIDQLLKGAADQSQDNSAAIEYAAIRNLLYRKNFAVEILGSFSPTGRFLSEWWKQLFGESEGKNNQALWLSSVKYSTDLHSLGQFIQDGHRVAFETVLKVQNTPEDVVIPPPISDEDDGVGYLTGKTLETINSAAYQATIAAHHDAAYGGVPVLVLTIPEMDSYNIGAFLYFMMMSCAISAYILAPEGNPFNQPGVEFYKENMFKLLGKT